MDFTKDLDSNVSKKKTIRHRIVWPLYVSSANIAMSTQTVFSNVF